MYKRQVQKFWTLHEKIKNRLQKKQETNLSSVDNSLEVFINSTINKVNISLEKFSYNVIVANLHETFNFLNKIIDNENTPSNLFKNYIKILKIMLPIVPHLASECLEDLGAYDDISWPIIDEKYLKKKSEKIVIQINGKKRGIIEIDDKINEPKLIEKIKQMNELNKYLESKSIVKSIYIKDKLINLIIK